jgi:hypothetical protein
MVWGRAGYGGRQAKKGVLCAAAADHSYAVLCAEGTALLQIYSKADGGGKHNALCAAKKGGDHSHTVLGAVGIQNLGDLVGVAQVKQRLVCNQTARTHSCEDGMAQVAYGHVK